jgi:transposase-like protein
MPKGSTPGKPTTRRYSPDEKAAAVRMVRTLRAELGTEHGTVNRVASQVGYGTSRCGRGSVRPTSTRVTCRVSAPATPQG